MLLVGLVPKSEARVRTPARFKGFSEPGARKNPFEILRVLKGIFNAGQRQTGRPEAGPLRRAQKILSSLSDDTPRSAPIRI